MAPYDSDSSGAENNDDYTETNVLLGYASEEPAGDTISYLGGTPTWLDPTNPPSAALAKCKVCKDFMVLLLQLNGDLPEQFPGHERRIYVFACKRNTCRRKEGCVRVLRGMRVTESVRERKVEEEKVEKVEVKEKGREKINIGESLFGAKPAGNFGANPFSNPGAGGVKMNPFSTGSSVVVGKSPFASPVSTPTTKTTSLSSELPKTFAAALNISTPPKTFGPPTPPEPWPAATELPSPYPKLYLVDADYEILDKVIDASLPTTATMDLDEGNSGGGKEDKEVFESTIDKTFQKFADRLAQNPEQVLRYEWSGTPLLYSKTDNVGKLLSSSYHKNNEKVKITGIQGIPKCGNCGKERVFEVQLTPHAISELERGVEGKEALDGMEWGTIVVGVCRRDCVLDFVEKGEVGWLEEWVGVQWEEVGR